MARALKDVAIAMDGFTKAAKEAFDAQVTLTVEQAKMVFKAIALDVFNRIRADTPFDTGFARSGWRIEARDEGNSVVITIWNGVVYIVALEYGHSRQAPNGMLRINFNKARDRLVQARKELLGE